MRAFASGCSALTGVEAIANAVPAFRAPRAHRAQHTEVMLGVVLGVMLLGLSVLIRKFHIGPVPGTTVLAELTNAAIGHNLLFYAVQMITLGAADAGREHLVRRPAGAAGPAGQG